MTFFEKSKKVENLSGFIWLVNFLCLLLQSKTVDFADVARLGKPTRGRGEISAQPGQRQDESLRGDSVQCGIRPFGADNLGSYQSGQMGQTVNLLAYAFGGSNPSLPTKKVPVGVARFPVVPACGHRGGRGLTLIRYVFAEVAQLIEHQPSKLRVASLSLVFRSRRRRV